MKVKTVEEIKKEYGGTIPKGGLEVFSHLRGEVCKDCGKQNLYRHRRISENDVVELDIIECNECNDV